MLPSWLMCHWHREHSLNYASFRKQTLIACPTITDQALQSASTQLSMVFVVSRHNRYSMTSAWWFKRQFSNMELEREYSGMAMGWPIVSCKEKGLVFWIEGLKKTNDGALWNRYHVKRPYKGRRRRGLRKKEKNKTHWDEEISRSFLGIFC